MMLLPIVCASVLGAALASVLACVPGLHIYNLLAVLFLLSGQSPLPPEWVFPLVAALVTGFAFANTIPSVFLAAPDESAVFTVLPGQKYLQQGRGWEAVMLTSLGGLAAVYVLVFVVGPLAPRALPVLHVVLAPHYHWMIWCVITFLLMSEWPKDGGRGPAGWRRFLRGWKTLAAGLLTFGLSGLLGFLLFYRSPLPPSSAFQNLMPAFVGLFTVPWLMLNLVSRVSVPPQRFGGLSGKGGGGESRALFHGALSGLFGGAFAALVPAVTGGVGGLLAGHAAALRDDRAFLISQGASKTTYYVGGLLLLFVPGSHLTRGGAAGMLVTRMEPAGYRDYYMTLAAVAFAGAAAFWLVSPLTRAVASLIDRFGFHRLSVVSLLCAVTAVLVITGWPGLMTMIVAAGIGLIPPLFGSRRMNCLGIILLPVACNLSGCGGAVAHWLRLI